MSGVRIVCPYTIIYPATKAILKPLEAEFVYVGDSNYDYALLLERLFAESRIVDRSVPAGHRYEPFVLVEHDIAPTFEQIKEVAECPEPLCGFPYIYYPGKITWALGCAKFGAEALKAPVDWYYASEEREICRAGWRDCFPILAFRLMQYHGIQPHFHNSLVKHFGIRDWDTGELLVGT